MQCGEAGACAARACAGGGLAARLRELRRVRGQQLGVRRRGAPAARGVQRGVQLGHARGQLPLGAALGVRGLRRVLPRRPQRGGRSTHVWPSPPGAAFTQDDAGASGRPAGLTGPGMVAESSLGSVVHANTLIHAPLPATLACNAPLTRLPRLSPLMQPRVRAPACRRRRAPGAAASPRRACARCRAAPHAGPAAAAAAPRRAQRRRRRRARLGPMRGAVLTHIGSQRGAAFGPEGTRSLTADSTLEHHITPLISVCLGGGKPSCH